MPLLKRRSECMTRSSGTNEVSTAITLQITLEMAARILDKLRQSPFSVEELAFDLKRSALEVRRLVNAMLREGSIVKLDTDREGGPFYALAGYVEPTDRLDNSDLVVGRDYSGQYEAPIWRDDA